MQAIALAKPSTIYTDLSPRWLLNEFLDTFIGFLFLFGMALAGVMEVQQLMATVIESKGFSYWVGGPYRSYPQNMFDDRENMYVITYDIHIYCHLNIISIYILILQYVSMLMYDYTHVFPI